MTDDFIQTLLSSPGSKEALAWLRGGSETDFRSIGELETNEESIELVERLYTVGAEEVLAVEISEFPEGQNTGQLLVKLPSDAAKRNRILGWASSVAEQQGFEAERDTGQHYIFVSLD